MASGREAAVPLIDAASTPLVPALLRDQWKDATEPDLLIHPEDEMLLFAYGLFDGSRDQALAQYVNAGLGIASTLSDVARWRWGSLSNAGSLLDFASGFGRLTRFLLPRFDRAKITVADIYADAMEFQRDHFGVRAVRSTTRPDELELEGPFDLINVTSLFTHLPGRTFHAWLSRLSRLLAPGGVLCFTVHDLSLLEGGAGEVSGGIVFVAESESRSLDPEEYGSTWVSETYVREVAREVIPGASVHRLERAIGRFQDLYLVVNEAGIDFSALRFDGGCNGFIDGFRRSGDATIHCYGWAANRHEPFSAERIDIVIGAETVATAAVGLPREDVVAHFGDPRYLGSGWECRIIRPTPHSDSFDVCIVKAVSSSGAETILAIDTVASLLLADATRRLGHGEAQRGADLSGDAERRSGRPFLQRVLSRIRS
jgi:SAM-dependent methyltransferase